MLRLAVDLDAQQGYRQLILGTEHSLCTHVSSQFQRNEEILPVFHLKQLFIAKWKLLKTYLVQVLQDPIPCVWSLLMTYERLSKAFVSLSVIVPTFHEFQIWFFN